MAVDLSKLSDAELQAIASGNMASLSDETLQILAGQTPQQPSTLEVLKEAAAELARRRGAK